MESLYELKIRDKLALRRRSRLEVVMEILEGTRKPARLTHIMSKEVANIDYANARAFLTYLKGMDLIRYIQMADDTFYQTTDEGRRVLRVYDRLMTRVGIHG